MGGYARGFASTGMAWGDAAQDNGRYSSLKLPKVECGMNGRIGTRRLILNLGPWKCQVNENIIKILIILKLI